MNRSRINLILGVLLFPISDPQLQKKDLLFEYCVAYRELISVKVTDSSMIEEKENKNRAYKAASEALIQYLADVCRSRVRSYDDLQMICELYYPLLKIDRYIETFRHMDDLSKIRPYMELQKEIISSFYMERMRQIALSLLTYRDGVLAIRTWNNRENNVQKDLFCLNHVFDKVEIWNMLNVYVSPDLFMALFIVESGLGDEALYGQKSYVSLPDKLLVKVLQKGLAENHLHFNAGLDYEAIWLNKVNLWNWIFSNTYISENSEIQNIEAALFRLLCAIFLSAAPSESFLIWAEKFHCGAFVPLLRALYTGENIGLDKDKVSLIIKDILNPEISRDKADYLLYEILSDRIELKTSSEFILLYDSCRYMKKCPLDTGFTRIFLQYIRIKNAFIQKVQQSNLISGLRHFRKYYHQMRKEAFSGRNKESVMLDAFRAQSKIVGLRKLEIRIVPDVKLQRLYDLDDEKSIEEITIKLCRQLINVFNIYRQYIFEEIMGVYKTEEFLNKEKILIRNGASFLESVRVIMEQYGAQVNKQVIPVLGITYHFIKNESTDNFSGYHCWRDIDHRTNRYSNHRFFLRQRMALLGIAIEKLRETIPKLNEYIVGVDAASDENAMEPWMFSLAYMQMRSKKNTKPVGIDHTGQNKSYYNIKNLGFTYHVGEDYRHIVSGLRHIDEVIERFFYKAGDRLGHALALGVNIRKWIQDTEVVAMPIQEQLDNLLWIWGKAVNGELNLPVQLEKIEEKILVYAEKIYMNISGISVRLLYQAYDMKFSSNHRELLIKLKDKEKEMPKIYCDFSNRSPESEHTYCKLINEHCAGYKGVWTVERLISTIYCPVFEERGNQVEMVAIKENEYAIYECLQKYLQKKVAQKGIYIETNPTSNLNIGDMKELAEHPIFRLSPLKPKDDLNSSVLVTVNSDNPAVFNTNVENELAYIYYALEHAGYSKDEVLPWIDKIRRNGMDGSFIAKEKDCKTLLEDCSYIMDELKKFC